MNILLVLYILFIGFCFAATYLISMIMLVIMTVIKYNVTCDNTIISLQSFDIMAIIEQLLFLIISSILLAIIFKTNKFNSISVMFSSLHTFLLLCIDGTGIIVLSSVYNNECFEQIKLLWIFTLIYLVLTFIDVIIFGFLVLSNISCKKQENEIILN